MQSTAQVIPFRFETREVRTMLVDDQPWFIAADVAAALEYRDSEKMTRMLDGDEKDTQIVGTLGGGQRMLVINESGLYSAILRSRKLEAKPFKKWVTAEVLPAIRKHGRYHDEQGKMATLIGETIGTDGFHMLGALIKGKVASLPAAVQRKATAKIWAQTHAAFGVRSAGDIPASQLDSARNFIAAYNTLEGEWIRGERNSPPVRLPIDFPIGKLAEMNPHAYKGGGLVRVGSDPSITLEARHLCGMDSRSPTMALLRILEQEGYAVEACRLEVMALRHHVESYIDTCRQIEMAIRYRGAGDSVTFKVRDGVSPTRETPRI